ncbi:putative disease resistance protein rga3 [Phtheirospermum japonicum]|uniref:Putative disease resistance protein rga3 n=1 Tax=Phtheirospermum japonicum TaxID=374723 RepID=A0A830BMW9_9LAMI|nr:putative disease resistance protein rga3 [Phtheirospermum japonicum]
METKGNTFLNLLLQSSLLQVAKRDIYLNVTHCNMHDLVHDLACSLTDGDWQSRHIGYKSSGDGFLSILKGKERYVRTLFFNGKVSDITFSDFESLHSLTLEGEDDIDVLPTSIRKLKHLRYLDISETSITFLPDSIGELYHLQTLRAERWELEKLPDSLSNLISLRHLHIPYGITLPPEIGKLTSLQTLPYFLVGDEKGCGISELGNLKDLKGKLEIRNLERVRDNDESKMADLLGKPGIYELNLVWDESREGREANDESVLEGLQPHPNLKGLEICGFNGKRLPLWTSRLNNLMEIVLRNCWECEELPMLGHLPHLKSLCLLGLKNVKTIGSSFYGIDKCRKSGNGIVVFPALERLMLKRMPNLIEWDQVDLSLPSEGDETQRLYDEVVVFPCLKYLRITKCPQLTRAPSHFPCLEELEIDEVESSLALENICGKKLTSLTRLSISEVKGLECLPYWLFSNNHNLTELKILRCSSLRELPDDLHSLNSLEELEISWCPSLKSIPYSSSGGESQQGFTSVRKLEIEYCEGLTNLTIEMVESYAPSLEILRLYWLSSITNMGMVIGCLHKMTRLRELTINGVPKFSIKEIGSLSLQRLNILELYGMEHWDSLPDQLQHLTSLERLYLVGFGIEALPEWFGNLSSLKRLNELELWRCEKLRHLPSKQAMQRLSKLTHLNIHNCPLLIVDSEWPKISHIPNIEVDYYRISYRDGH